MSLQSKIETKLSEALKAQDKKTYSTLRLIIAAIKDTIIAKKIKKDGIYFAGIDFIDGKLNGDINVTSPTGIKTYFDLSQINLAKTFWKGL